MYSESTLQKSKNISLLTTSGISNAVPFFIIKSLLIICLFDSHSPQLMLPVSQGKWEAKLTVCKKGISLPSQLIKVDNKLLIAVVTVISLK